MKSLMLLLPVATIALAGCAHDPNRGITREQARDAAARVRPRPMLFAPGAGPMSKERVSIPFPPPGKDGKLRPLPPGVAPLGGAPSDTLRGQHPSPKGR